MSNVPKPADPQTRASLLEAAARVLVDEGPGALTTRRLATEVDASTMAVYTHFGGMDELREAMCREGFDRLATFLDDVPRTEDPVADVSALGAAYFFNALANSHLYRLMFVGREEGDEEIGRPTFDRLIAAVARAVDAGRFKGDPEALATQLWAMQHGIVTLHLGGLLTLQEAIECDSEMGRNLFVGFGDEPGKAAASIEKIRERLGVEQLG
jgi:AcrR family transcriptional regulator